MKKSEIKFILIIIVIGIVIIVNLVNKKKSNQNVELNTDSSLKDEEVLNKVIDPNSVDEKFVKIDFEGVQHNISDKLNETKIFGNYKASNIQLSKIEGCTCIYAEIECTSENQSNIKTMYGYDEAGTILEKFENVVNVKVTFWDENNQEINSLVFLMNNIEVGKKDIFEQRIVMNNIINAYDISFEIM